MNRKKSKSNPKLDSIIKEIKWISKKEINAYKPVKKVSVVEWCENNMILDKKTTAYPGLYKTSLTPFVVDIMNIYENSAVEEIVLMFASQVSKTVMMTGMALSSLAQNEGSHLWVQDTEDKAVKKISKLRFKPTLDGCQALKENLMLDGGKESAKHYNFARASISFIGANSPGAMASDSIKRIFADEVDKYPKEFTTEAGAIQLLRSRLKAFKFDRKLVLACTPTSPEGTINSEFESCQYKYYYFVPCPQCGEFQILKDTQLRTHNNIEEFSPENEEEIIKTTYYECEHCQHIIRERHKQQMLRQGEWRTIEGEPLKPHRRIGFQLSSLYSPFIEFGKFNRERLKSLNDPLLLKDYYNSWLGLPYRERSFSVDETGLQGRLSLHKKGVVPRQARFVVGAVDCQKDHYWGIKVAFGYRYKSWVIDYKKTQTREEMRDFMREEMLSHDGNKIYRVKKVAMDAGYLPEDVYLFCNQPENQELFLPVVGAIHKMNVPYKIAPYLFDIISQNRKMRTMRGTINTEVYKESIYERLSRNPNSKGSFNLYRNPEKELCRQLTSEEKQEIRVKGKPSKWEWVKKFPDNHLLDCAVYCFALADYLGIYRLNPSEEHEIYENENMFAKEDEKSPFKEVITEIVSQEKEEVKKVKPKKKFKSSDRFGR
jgi:phage terminase large subunit GpA-like protein